MPLSLPLYVHLLPLFVTLLRGHCSFWPVFKLCISGNRCLILSEFVVLVIPICDRKPELPGNLFEWYQDRALASVTDGTEAEDLCEH